MSDRPIFTDRAFARLSAAIREAAADVPELEAAAVVVVWRLPGQLEVPSLLVVGADGPLETPDQLLRLHLGALALERYCVDRSEAGVVAVGELVRRLATEGLSRVTPPEAQDAPRPAGGGSEGDAPGRTDLV